MSGCRQSEWERVCVCMHSTDVEQLLHLGTLEPLIQQ